MAVSSSRADFDYLSELWIEWQLRVLMLLSLFLQILLTILAKKQKYSTRRWLGDFLWLAYLSADWVAAFSLGVLARSKNDFANLIPVFWAPILLVHLGGPETITAYSMDQVTKLWLSRLFELATHVGVASYVLSRLWSKNALALVTIPIFISGLIKYGERIWVLKRHQRHKKVSWQPSAKSPIINFADTSAFYNSSRYEVKCLHEARLLFKTSKMLFRNYDLISFDQEITDELISEKSAAEAFMLTAIEQSFMYDWLYSKVTKVSRLRIILHSITFLSSIAALISFSIMTQSKKIYSKNDTIISYLLLIGVFLLESYSILGFLIFSDSAMIWLTSSETAALVLEGIKFLSLLVLPLRRRKRWSRSMAQHNLINAQSKKTLMKVLLKHFPGKWYNIHGRVDVDEHLMELIFSRVKGKRSRYSPETSDFIHLEKILAEKGDEVLQNYKDYCFETDLGWSITGVEFAHSLLTWHIATHICYFEDFGQKGVAKNAAPEYVKMSRSLSNYMCYLLVQRPAMLPKELSETRYSDTSIHLFRVILETKSNEWKDETPDEKSEDSLANSKRHITDCIGQFQEAEVDACLTELLQRPSDKLLNVIEVQDEGEKSALSDGCVLALSLQSFERQKKLEREKKWEMISEMWVDMLMYAASRCEWKEHAEALTQGGELISHVSLLMAHFRLSRQCPPDKIRKLECRSERLHNTAQNCVSQV